MGGQSVSRRCRQAGVGGGAMTVALGGSASSFSHRHGRQSSGIRQITGRRRRHHHHHHRHHRHRLHHHQPWPTDVVIVECSVLSVTLFVSHDQYG